MTDQLIQDQVGTEAPAETGPAAPVRIAWAPVPKVNLLPIEILEGRRFRRTQLLLGAAVFVVLLLAGAGTFLAQRGVQDANDTLLAAQDRVSTLQAEQTRFAAVPKVIALVDAAEVSRTQAMGYDVLWYRYLNDIDGARPDGVKYTSLTMTLTGLSATPTAGADPLSEAGIGGITLEGTVEQYNQVSSLMEALDKMAGLTSTALASATKDEKEITFSGSTVVDIDALSGRYNKKAS